MPNSSISLSNYRKSSEMLLFIIVVYLTLDKTIIKNFMNAFDKLHSSAHETHRSQHKSYTLKVISPMCRRGSGHVITASPVH